MMTENMRGVTDTQSVTLVLNWQIRYSLPRWRNAGFSLYILFCCFQYMLWSTGGAYITNLDQGKPVLEQQAYI